MSTRSFYDLPKNLRMHCYMFLAPIDWMHLRRVCRHYQRRSWCRRTFARLYDEMVDCTNEVVSDAARLFRFMRSHHVALTKDSDMMISGCAVLMALQAERFDTFDINIYCKRRVWFDLYHHLTLSQNMSLVNLLDKQRDQSLGYVGVHSVMTFRRSWNTTKVLRVTVLQNNDVSIPTILELCDFNIATNTFDGVCFCCSAMYSVVHRSIACPRKRRRLSKARVLKYQPRGYSFCNVHVDSANQLYYSV